MFSKSKPIKAISDLIINANNKKEIYDYAIIVQLTGPANKQNFFERTNLKNHFERTNTRS